MDLAASIQVPRTFLKITKDIAKTTGEKNLCLSGGVALNCVANGRLIEEKVFDNVWIRQLLRLWWCYRSCIVCLVPVLRKRETRNGNDSMRSFLGPEFGEEIENQLQECGAKYHKLKEKELINTVADALSSEKAIGWMQGRMEFGPRALGNRSIIADPRSPYMQKQLNLKVKYRESFRPFAPSILQENLEEWFNLDKNSPYMLLVASVREDKYCKMTEREEKLFGIEKLNIQRSTIPAVTHVDYSARIQTVDKNTNSKYYKLISRFKELTGCPIVVNTSFNIRGEPIVLSPTDAFKCFMGTDLDILAIGNFLLYKPEQNKVLKKNYIDSYGLD